MVSTHVGVSLWYDAQTIVHSMEGVVLLFGHCWLDCGTGHTCLLLPSGRVPPCCHRYWNLSYIGLIIQQLSWSILTTGDELQHHLRYMWGRNHLIWSKLQVSVRYICIHIIHIAVNLWWGKRAFWSQMLSQEVYCASINGKSFYFIASNNLYHVHGLHALSTGNH